MALSLSVCLFVSICLCLAACLSVSLLFFLLSLLSVSVHSCIACLYLAFPCLLVLSCMAFTCPLPTLPDLPMNSFALPSSALSYLAWPFLTLPSFDLLLPYPTFIRLPCIPPIFFTLHFVCLFFRLVFVPSFHCLSHITSPYLLFHIALLFIILLFLPLPALDIPLPCHGLPCLVLPQIDLA